MPEKEDREILQLVHRQQSARPKLSGLQIVKFKKPLSLPALEHDRADSTEGAQGTSHNDISNTNVEVSHMVSGPGDALGISIPLATSHYNHSRSKKRKITSLDKQALELDSMEDQRRFLESQGLSNYAVDCILSNGRRVRRRFRYSSVQQHFLDWRISKEITSEISTPQIINYLAEIYAVDNLKVGSIKA
ncbi:hypothetical protein AYI68_g5298 [Smittium mucronatum]|uniref:Uncharacterized protein n=1 Tax=Smittium mucronatum TaxID=133383 RepID=A0A1R0GUM6_9FUNG|nr:hypothetical protein AYI68_g5298 [Smittium mucronatum]